MKVKTGRAVREGSIAGVVVGGLLALTCAAQATTTSPESEKYYETAQREAENGNSDAAIVDLKNAVRVDPTNTEARYQLAVLYLKGENQTPALVELEALQRRGYGAQKVSPLLAKCYLALGRFKDVLTKVFPDTLTGAARSSVLASQGRASIALDDLPTARKTVDDALKANPVTVDALVASAMLLSAEGKVADAEGQVKKARLLGDQVELLSLGAELRHKQNDQEGAGLLLDQGVKSFSKSTVLRIQRGTLNLERGKIAEVNEDVTWLLARDPKQPLALFLRAAVLGKDGKYQAASEILLGLPTLLERYPPAMYLLAEASLRQDHLDVALRYAQQYLNAVPNDPSGLKLIAAVHQSMKDPVEAAAILEPLSMRFPADNQLRLQLASALMEGGRSEEAIALFRQGIIADPSNVQAQMAMAETQLRSGKSEQAIADLEKFVHADSNSLRANTLLVMAYLQMRQPENASRAARAMVAANVTSPAAYNLQGTVYLAGGDLDGAGKAFHTALEKDAKFTPAALNLARLEERSGHPDTARQVYEKITTQEPENITAYEGLAGIALSHGDVDAAAAYYKRAIVHNPSSVPLRLHFIDMLLERRRFPAALIEARDFLNGNPHAAEALDALGRTQFAGGDANGGLASYQRLVNNSPGNAEALRRLGRAYIAVGAKETLGGEGKYLPEARASFESALKIAPDDLSTLSDRIEMEPQSSDALTVAQAFVTERPASVPRLVALGDAQMRTKQGGAASITYRRAWSVSKSGLTAARLYGALLGEEKGMEGLQILKDWTKDHPSDYDVRFMIATHYLKTGNTAAAIAETQAISTAFPDNAVLLNNLAWLYAASDPTRAMGLAERAYVLAPQSADVLDTLGWLHVSAARVPQGIALLRQAYNTAPTRPDIGLHYAHALERDSKAEAARKVLKQVLAAETKFPERADAEALAKKLGGG